MSSWASVGEAGQEEGCPKLRHNVHKVIFIIQEGNSTDLSLWSWAHIEKKKSPRLGITTCFDLKPNRRECSHENIQQYFYNTDSFSSERSEAILILNQTSVGLVLTWFVGRIIPGIVGASCHGSFDKIGWLIHVLDIKKNRVTPHYSNGQHDTGALANEKK